MKLKHSPKQNYAKFIFAAGIIGIGGLLLAPEFYLAANAEEDNAIDPTKYSVSISSSDSISLNLETVPYTNVIRAGKDTVTTAITHPASTQSKFSLFVSMEGANNALVNGTNTIPATSGTMENPVALKGNEWGFALNHNTTGIPSTNGFDETYNTPDPGKDSKWAGVPTVGNEQLLQTLSMNQSSTSTDVYYAVSAKDDLAEGTYTGTVVYTAMYNASESDEMTLSPTSGTTDTEITLTTAAVTSMGDPGDVEVKLGDTVCPNPTASVTAQGLVQIKCKVPTLPASGNYTVTAKLDKTGVTYTTAPQQFAYTKPLIFTVNYDANGGSGVPDTQTGIPEGSATDYTFTLTEGTTPTRSGYTFGGWTTVATNQAGAYSPGSELYLKKDNPEITLYAIWVPNSEMGFGSLSGSTAKMQNMTSTVCANASIGTTGRLQDTRDYKIYYVTKEADNKCWMTQNLSLELRTDKALTPTDSNVSANWTPERKTVPNGNLSSSNWATSSDYTHPYSFNPADDYFVTNGATSGNDPETTSGDAHYTAGNYYTWSAAVASNDTEGHSTRYENMPDSICPKGWRLPQTTSSSSTEFGALLHTTGITSSDTSTSYATDGFIKIRQDPLWLVRSGDVYLGSRGNLGYNGGYWSSAVYSSSSAYNLYFYQNYPYPMGNYTRYCGQSIRCLAI